MICMTSFPLENEACEFLAPPLTIGGKPIKVHQIFLGRYQTKKIYTSENPTPGELIFPIIGTKNRIQNAYLIDM